MTDAFDDLGKLEMALAQRDALVKALEDIEEATEKLAALRTPEMYLAMLDAGQEFVLADLQDARNEAKRVLAAVGSAVTASAPGASTPSRSQPE